MVKRFKTRLEGRGPTGSWTFLPIPFSVEAAFGTRARVAVTGTINGVPFRNSVMPEGDGTHAMMVRKSLREAAGIANGDRVDVVMRADTAPRKAELPPELRSALRGDVQAGAFFRTLSYSCQKEYATWVAEAKRPETRAMRVSRTIALLRARKRQR